MKHQTVSDLESAIKQRTAQFNQEVEALQAQLAAARLETPDHQLAKQLHDMLCTWNHTDGCGWYYEMKNNQDDWTENNQDDWTGDAHGRYLINARIVMHQCDLRKISVDTAIEIYKMVKGP